MEGKRRLYINHARPTKDLYRESAISVERISVDSDKDKKSEHLTQKMQNIR
jgi:hypothetical protein